MKLKFISYSGRYPNLCRGKLIVKIGNKKVSFGTQWDKDEKGDYPPFWAPGGSAGFVDRVDWEPIVTQGDWYLDANEKDYPKKIWKILPQLIDLMNKNVSPACCGGCL